MSETLEPAPILELGEFEAIRDKLGSVVCTSGGFDPIHPGHASCIVDSKKFADTLVVIVNGDNFLTQKKGRPFQDLQTRCQIVACVRGVDYVVAFEIEDDPTVCEALRRIRPDVFTKGGDRTGLENIPEWAVCQEIGTRIECSVGLKKDWSSSNFLADWVAFSAKRSQE